MPIKLNKYFKIILTLSLAVLFLFGGFDIVRQSVFAQTESDAIGVRVLANPHHFSPLAWYLDQGFKGNPTVLTVDGYDAIQDGRTVYVNVANIDDSGTLYTNIYLISYTQDAKPETIQIFNKILSKWKFNTNLTSTGKCFNQSDVNEVCLADADCSGGGFCDSEKAKVTRDIKRLAGVVDIKTAVANYAQRNGHYPLLTAGTYITGQTLSTWPSWKAEFTTELGITLPLDPINKLGDCGGAAGQYDPLTCWDNKSKTFAGTLPDNLPAGSRVLVYATDAKGANFKSCAEMESGYLIGDDQGACAGSARLTAAPTVDCGDLIGIQGQPFSGFLSVNSSVNGPMLLSIPDLPPAFNIISDSNSSTYSSNKQCQDYFSKIINAVSAKRKANNKLLSEITGSTWSAGPCYPVQFPGVFNQTSCAANKSANMAAFGFTAADFGGLSFVFDENEGERSNNNINDLSGYCWPDTVMLNNCDNLDDCTDANINCGSANIPFFNAKCNGISSANTIISRATIVSSNAAVGTYPITIKVTDASGATTVKTCSINITGNAFIIYPVADQKISVAKKISFSVYAANSKKDYTGMNFTFTGSPAISGLSCGAISTTADGRAKCDVTFSSASVYSGVITVTANDAAGDKFTSQTFNLNVYNNAPVVQPLKCDQATRVGQVYMPKTASKNYDGCQLAAIDPDGDKISSYNASVYPPGFAKLTGAGIFAGTPTTAGIYDIDFTAADQYGANSKPLPFQLHVNTYCGDGIKQDNPPNGESNGGPGNDGYEQCDCGNLTNQQCVDAGCTDPSTGKVDYSNCNQTNSTTGVPPAGQSSISWQYGCSKTCVNSNGGYCGDGIIQDGLYSKFASAAGQQTLPNNLLIKHGKTNFGEQCDFGGDINCCDKSTCQWTTGPTDEVSIAGDAYLAKGETMNLDIPACRGVSGGTFTATLRPYGQGYGPDTGPAIVFVTDLSGSMFDPTYSITAQVMENIVDSLFNQAITKQVNIHVGAIATYGVYDQSTGFFVGAVGKEVNIGNLKGSGGISQRDALLSSITSYSKIADPPDFSSAFDTARTMLTSYANAAPNEKYIIFLTDGYPAGAKAEADAARNAGIKVYVAAFNNWDQRFNDGTLDLTTCSSYLCQSLRSMCSWSNDNGNLNVCYKNINLDNSNNSAFTGYTYYVGNKSGVEPINPPNPDLVGSRLAIIYNNIVADILSRMPTNITYTVVGGATNDLSNFASANFALPASVTVCDPSGATSCNPNSFVIKADFNGTGQVEFNNFKLNVVPLCKVE